MHSRPALRALWFLSAAAVIVLSLLPTAAPTPGIPHADKFAHALAYAWLAGLGLYVWAGMRAGVLLLAVFGLGLGMECVQAFIPGRFFSLWDMAANAAGVLLGWRAGRRAVHRGRTTRGA
jgi:VanZ family protein